MRGSLADSDAYNVNDIAEAITEVLTNESLRKKLIDKGIKKIDEYDWSVFINAVLNGLARL